MKQLLTNDYADPWAWALPPIMEPDMLWPLSWNSLLCTHILYCIVYIPPAVAAKAAH